MFMIALRMRKNSLASSGLVKKSAYSEVVHRVHVRDGDLVILDTFAHVEVAPFDVFNFLVMFRIASGVSSSRVVATQRDRLAVGSPPSRPSSERNFLRWTASVAASEAAMSSASQEDRAALDCFLEPQLMAAELYMNTKPEVECLTAQSLSVIPASGARLAS